jgi:peroxiredoxin
MVAAGALPVSASDQAGRRAPGFTLPDQHMKYHDLYDYRGKVVLLDFMKTSCPHCVMLAKTLDRVKRKYGPKVVLLSVVLPPDTVRTVGSFMKENGLMNLDVLFDCGQMSASYVRPSPQNPSIDLPYLFLIDQRGMIFDAYQPDDTNKSIFEGDGLIPILDKLLKAGEKADLREGRDASQPTTAELAPALSAPACAAGE